MNRRQFLGECAAASAAANSGWGQAANPLDRIAVLSWSFRDAFAKTRAKTGWVPQTDLDIMDYPQLITDRYHIHNVEVQTMYLEPQPSFIKVFRERLRGYRGIYTIEAGFNGNPYDQAQLVLDQLVKYV
jgi:hypothetical protein